MELLRKCGRWFVVSILCGIVCIGAAGAKKSPEPDIVDVILTDKSSFFHLDISSYPVGRKALPIGVFDSGTGGLTVLDAVVNFDRYDNKTHRHKPNGDGLKDFGREYFIYLGDKANMPYGNYAKENNTPLLREHIIKDAQFLMGNKYYALAQDHEFRNDKPQIKAIVIACNTATAFGKADIERLVDKAGLEIKVIGVIDAGVRAALALVARDDDASIAVMASAGTVSSQGYVRALRAQIAAGRYTGNISIFQQAGIGVAGAIDGSSEYIQPKATLPRKGYRGPSETSNDAPIDVSLWPRYGFDCGPNALLATKAGGRIKDVQLNSVANYIAYHVTELMEKIRKTQAAAKLKVIVLGCTHYPLHSDVFRGQLKHLYDYQEKGEYIYRPFMAKRIELVDPAPNVANELYQFLAEKELFNGASLHESRFFVSVPNCLNPNVKLDSAGSFTYEYKYGRTAGRIQEYVKRIPFGKTVISPDIYDALEEKMPAVFEMILADQRNRQREYGIVP